MIQSSNIHVQCRQTAIAINDAMELLAGKWTPRVIMALLVREILCFTELKKEIGGVSSKVLSASLKRLEQHLIVERNVLPIQTGKVEYQLTDHGKSLEKLLEELSITGIKHRIVLTGRNVTENARVEVKLYGTKNAL
jgi:DNA-binding HxlR family transcriptional regulator